MQAVAMHIIDRRLNPGGKSLANRQRFMRRAKALVQGACTKPRRTATSRMPEGRRGLDPADGVHEPRFRARQGGMRDMCCPATRNTSRATAFRAPGEGGGGSEAGRSGDGEDEFRFALCREEFLDLFLEDLELPDLAKRKLARRRARALAPRRLFDLRLAGEPLGAAHHAHCAVAPHRAEAAAAGRRSPQLRGRDRATATRGGVAPSLLAELERIEAPRPGGSRTSIRSTCATAGSSAAEAGRAGGDVLPDGRVRLDDRAHEGPGQAVLHAALPVPEAPLPARRRRVHPPHAPGAGSGRGDILPPPRTGGTVVSTRARGDARDRQRALPPDDWNIYAAQASDGDNSTSDSDDRRAAADDDDPAGLPVLRLSRSRRDRRQHVRDAAIPSLWQAYTSVCAPTARRWRCARSATAATSIRCSANCSQRRRKQREGRVMTATRPNAAVRGRGLGFRDPAAHPRRDRGDRDRRARARHLSRTRSR